MLHIEKLVVEVEETQVLNGVSMEFEKGKNYCILGKNGS
jgi:Fe-S cluster assembly ATPase SufC